MKNFLKYFGLSLAIFFTSLMFVGCNEVSLDDIEIEGLPSQTVAVGETFELQVVFKPETASDKRVEWWTPQNDLIKIEEISDTLISVETLGAGRITIFARALDGNITKSVTFEITTGSLNLRFGEAINGVITRTYNATPQAVEVTNDYDNVVYEYIKEGESVATTTPPTDAGTYMVKASVNTANYVGESIVTLVIEPQTIEVKADNKEKVYGASDVALTKRIEGQIYDEGVVISGDLSREVGERAGNYKIIESQKFVASGENATNYDVKFIEGNFYIRKASAQVNVSVSSFYYGCTPSAISYSVIGLKNDDTMEDLGISIEYPEDLRDAGLYNLNCTATTNDYELTYNNARVNVWQANLTVTVANAEKTYKFDEPEYSYTLYNSQNTTDHSKLFYDDVIAINLVREEGEDAGKYTINAVCDVNLKNYRLNIVKGTLNINRREICVIAEEATKRYGQNDPEFTYKFESEIYDLPVEGEVQILLARSAGEDVGSYIITPKGTQEKKNYIINTEEGIFTITPALVTLKVDDVTIPYADPEPNYTFTVDPQGDPLQDDNSLQFNFTRPEGTVVGTYTVSLEITKEDKNYTISTETGVLTIRKRYLYYNIGSLSMAYYQNPDSTNITCVLNEKKSDPNVENINILSNVVVNLPWENDVGEYDITASLKAEVPNYEIEFSKGTLEIREAYILLKAKDIEVYYGDSFSWEILYKAGSQYLSKNPNADKVSFEYHYYDMAGNEMNGYPNTVGEYRIVINPVLPEGKNNYVVSIDEGKLTVKQAEIVATIEDSEIIYGHEVAPKVETTVDKGKLVHNIKFRYVVTSLDVGEQTVNIELIESEGSENYKIICDGAKLTIKQADVIINLDARKFKYGEEKEFTCSFGEGTDEVFLQDPSNLYILVLGEETAVGTYDIVCATAEKDDKHNYNVTINGAQYEILAREYKVKIDNATKKYGEADPTFSFTKLDEGDELLDGDEIVLTYTRTAGENVGEYEITATLQNTSDHFNVTIESGTLVITKRVLTITATNLEITEGQTPKFEYTISGDSILNDDIQFELSCAETTVGTHEIIITITKNNDNYDINCISGMLTVVATEPQGE